MQIGQKMHRQQQQEKKTQNKLNNRIMLQRNKKRPSSLPANDKRAIFIDNVMHNNDMNKI